MDNRRRLILIVALLVAAGLVAFSYLYFTVWSNRPMPEMGFQPVEHLSPAVESATTSASLGTQIYEQSQNPLQNKVPEASNPAVNPIEGVYKNPF